MCDIFHPATYEYPSICTEFVSGYITVYASKYDSDYPTLRFIWGFHNVLKKSEEFCGFLYEIERGV